MQNADEHSSVPDTFKTRQKKEMHLNNLTLATLVCTLISDNGVEGKNPAVNITTNERMLETYELTLLNIQIERCGGIRWCTFTLDALNIKPCCGVCSCDSYCMVRGDCCPDYDFMNYIGTTRFNDYDAFVLSFKRWSIVIRQNNLFILITPSLPSIRHACVRSQLLTPSRYIEMTPSYIMMTKCISTMTLGNRGKCEYSSLDEISSPTFEDVIPVQSVENGTIYRNKHCAECNIGAAPVIAWSVIVRCADEQIPTIYTTHIENPQAVLDFVLEQRRAERTKSAAPACDITFEPNTYETEYRHGCLNEDASYCSETDDSYTKTLCLIYTSPVFIYNYSNGLLTVLKNAACLECKNSSNYEDSCDRHTTARSSLSLMLNVPIGLNGRASIPSDDLLHILFPENAFTGCLSGQVFDPSKKICRKTFCPKAMYPHNGKCRHMFISITGGTYIVFLRTDHYQDFTNVPNMPTHLLKAIFDIAKKFGSNTMGDTPDVSIWTNRNDTVIIHLALFISVNDHTYSITKRFIRRIISTPITLNVAEKSISLHLFIANTFTRVDRSIIDEATGEIYSRIFPQFWTPSPVKIRLDIRESNFCYRVRLLSNEYSIGQRNVIRYNINNRILGDYTWYPKESNNSILVCQEHVMNGTSSRFLNRVSEKEGWLAARGYNILIAPVLICITTIILVSICIIKDRKSKNVLRMQTDGVTDT